MVAFFLYSIFFFLASPTVSVTPLLLGMTSRLAGAWGKLELLALTLSAAEGFVETGGGVTIFLCAFPSALIGDMDLPSIGDAFLPPLLGLLR